MGIAEFLAVKNHERAGVTTFLRNKDLVPLPPDRRTWGISTFAAFGCIGQICLSAWMAAPALTSLGLSVPDSIGVVVVGNVIVTIFTVAVGVIGATWHIGYTMNVRSVFGIYGSIIGMWVRIILSVVWFGSQAWVGGQCVTVILSSWSHNFLTMKNTFPASVNMTARDLIGFLLFELISIPLCCIKPEKINIPTIVANIVSFFCMLGIVIWATVQNGGAGSYMHASGSLSGSSALGWAWVYGMTSWYGSLAAGVTNEADYTRFSTKRWSFLWGTIVSSIFVGTLIPIFGLIVASATGEMYGLDVADLYWNPLDIALDVWLGEDYSAKSRAGSFFVGLCFLLSQLCQNTVGNAFSGGMDLAGNFPRWIDIRRGSIITCLLSWVVQPWLFYNTSSVFLTVMSSFSVFLQPLIAVILCDYYVVRKRKVYLSELYTNKPGSTYMYTYGFNFRGLFAWVCGFTLGVPGLCNLANPNITVPVGLMNFYNGSTFFGFVMSFGIYWILCLIFPVQNAGMTDTVDIYGTFTPEEARRMNMVPYEEVSINDTTKSLDSSDIIEEPKTNF